MTNQILIKTLKWSKFSLLTPTKKSFIKFPSKGLITELDKLEHPVNRANTVASIYLGVTLAKRTMEGNWENAIDKVSVTTPEHITKAKSLIPILVFHLMTSIKEDIHPKKFTKIA